MLFNSAEFAIFLPLVFLLYWFVFNKNHQLQKVFLIGVSYLFYGWWDWRFLFLVIFSSTLDFWVGLMLGKIEDPKRRKLFFTLSCLTNLGFLGFFKYFNFFSDSFATALSKLGLHVDPFTLNIMLPVGISFYTFQSLGYTIDVYRKRLEPERDPLTFFAFISFFPQLVAGPIEKAGNLLPQFRVQHEFNPAQARDGLRQMLWGFFKKIVIADNCAVAVNNIFENYQDRTAGTLVIGAILFAFQIYCDFSGYSEIALGSARLLGFQLKRNFSYPYFSRDIGEFWRRWHISLSTWFRDYVYIPLGGSRVANFQLLRNTFIIFIISGFWHGANWTFIAWGALHAIFYIPLLFAKKNRKNISIVAEGKLLPSIKELLQILFTFMLVVFAWIFFRAPDIATALGYITHVIHAPFFPMDTWVDHNIIYLIILMMGVEWIQRQQPHALVLDNISSKAFRWVIYTSMCLLIFFYGGSQQSFIYFQF